MIIKARDFFDGESYDFKKEMEAETLLVDIACSFIKYRDKNGFTQKDLAKKLQITQAMVSKLENGDYNPTVKLLFEIAQKLEWNFKVEFGEETEDIYENNNEKTILQSNIYFENMGLAS